MSLFILKKLDIRGTFLLKELPYPIEYLKELEDYDKPLTELKTDHFLSKLTGKTPND